MIEENKYFAVDTNAVPWEERHNAELGLTFYRKEIFHEPETGMVFRIVKYTAGLINPAHTHPCGHGIYVLQGTLVTHKGKYGPGTFVWFPEGEVMEHGASAEGDVIAVFVTNKAFRIDYVGKK